MSAISAVHQEIQRISRWLRCAVREMVYVYKKYKDMRRVPYLEKQRRHKRSSRCNGRLGLRRNKMEATRRNEIIKLHDALLDRLGIKPDKYEREDSLMSAIEEIDDGQDVQASLVDVIKCVYGRELTDMIYKSVCANIKGPKAWAKERA